MKIREDYDLSKLITDWGFEGNGIAEQVVYDKRIKTERDGEYCSILVNISGEYNREVYFYYTNDLEDENLETDIIDYAVKIPDIIFNMIKEGVIVN